MLLMRELLPEALPDDESVLIRYIAIVVVLMARVAWADGRFSSEEEESMRDLLAHVDRISRSGVEAVCRALKGKLPQVSEEELELCTREPGSPCDGRERVEILRLLAKLAVVDGETSTAEHAELEAIAAELGISLADLASVEHEAATSARQSTPPPPILPNPSLAGHDGISDQKPQRSG